MSTDFKPLEIPPGVVSTPTKKMFSSNYSEVNCVRWIEGQLAPIGGQAPYTYSFASRCRRVHSWYGLDGISRIAYLCEKNLYVDVGGVLTDISPSVPIVAPVIPTTGGYSDGLYNQGVQITSAGSWTTSTPNIPMSGPLPGAVVGMDVYNVTSGLHVGKVSTYVGNALVLQANASNIGASGDLLNFGAYNDPRPLSTSLAMTRVPSAYSLDNFGAILYAMTSADGRLLFWDPSVGPPGAVATLNAASNILTSSPNITMPANPGSVLPGMDVYNQTLSLRVGTVFTYVGTALVLTGNAQNAGVTGNTLRFGNFARAQPATAGVVPSGRCFVVTPERFIMIMGTYNDGTGGANGSPRRFAWCDQENPGAWDYSNVTSQAGFLDIEPASPIMAAIASRTGVLLWTGKKAYRSRFLGLPYVYNYEELADGTTPWSPESMATTSSMVLWMSEQGVFSFDGTSILPVACKVRPWVDDDIDLIWVREGAFACHVETFSEWWWFFPQTDQTLAAPKPTRAIIYNYKEGWWSQARMSRTAGITAAYNSHTVMADDTIAYEHESGLGYPGELPWVETFDLNLVKGSRLVTIKQLLPDIEGDDLDDPVSQAAAIQSLLFSVFFRNSRSLGDVEQQSPQVPVRPNGYVDLRTTGRDLRLRIDLVGPLSVPFTLGQHEVDIVVRGDR